MECLYRILPKPTAGLTARYLSCRAATALNATVERVLGQVASPPKIKATPYSSVDIPVLGI